MLLNFGLNHFHQKLVFISLSLYRSLYKTSFCDKKYLCERIFPFLSFSSLLIQRSVCGIRKKTLISHRMCLPRKKKKKKNVSQQCHVLCNISKAEYYFFFAHLLARVLYEQTNKNIVNKQFDEFDDRNMTTIVKVVFH